MDKRILLGCGLPLVIVIFLGIAGYSWFSGTYNGLVQKEEGTNAAFSQVQNQYQRRYDLIPNLVETVKGFATQEKDVFLGVSEARAKIGSMTVTKEVLSDPEALKKYQEAQGQLGLMVSRLLSVTEKYPELKSNQNFLELQAQLEGTENRIAVERKRYNEVIQDYNTYLRTFPNSFIAGFSGFKDKAYFQAEGAAQTAPKVDFGKPPAQK